MHTANIVRTAIEAALDPGHFFVSDARLRVEHSADEAMPWDVFRGHLLAANHSTQVKHFAAWHVFVDDAAAPADVPLVSVLWDREAGRIYVIRQILTHTFEAYEETPGVILSRPVQKWMRELVGTIDPVRLSADLLPSELRVYVAMAVMGTSRLPITSLESPLPAFSLGQLSYLPALPTASKARSDSIEMLQASLEGERSTVERAKALETALRAASGEQLPAIVHLLEAWAASHPAGHQRVQSILHTLFNHVALSPYTGFVDRWIHLLSELANGDAVGEESIGDTIAWMLRHLCRHLTAFDLTTFHNHGANYPDALFLDALLKEYLRLLENDSRLWVDGTADPDVVRHAKQLRRRALRQACIVRKHYEGHRVPDAPTSQGENLRVLPEPFTRVPEEQILQSSTRRRTLFADEPLESLLGAKGHDALHAALTDLAHPLELCELGMAYFLDRPLGVAKTPGAVDRTPLVSYVAFSRAITRQRIAALERAGWLPAESCEAHVAAAEELCVAGVPVGSLPLSERPGVVSLADARRAAPDFVVIRTTRRSFDDFFGQYGWQIDDVLLPLLSGGAVPLQHALVVGCAPVAESRTPPTLRVYDIHGQCRVELGLTVGPDGTVSYVERGGAELVERLQLLRVWRQANDAEPLVEQDASEQNTWLTLRDKGLATEVGPRSP